MFYKSMNNISFKAKLKIDPSLTKTLKQSDIESIIKKTKTIVECPQMSSLLKADEVILSGLKNRGGEGVLIKIGNETIEIKSKNPINPNRVINQILLYTCAENDTIPKSGNPKNIIEAVKKLFIKKSK